MVFWRRAADMKRRVAFLASQSFGVLALEVPSDNDKSAGSAEQFFAAIHGIYRNDPVIQEHLSLEIVARKDSIVFYLAAPLHLKEFIEGQLYAQYPDLNIKQVPDYSSEVDLSGLHVACTKIKLNKEDVYPIKTYTDLEVDPMASITAVMSSLGEREQLWFQIVTRPVGDEWQNKGVDHVKAVRSGRKPSSAAAGFSAVGKALSMLAKEVVQPGSAGGAAVKDEPPKLSAPEEAALKAIEQKITKLGYETIFRMVSIAEDDAVAKARGSALLGALKQFNTTNLNGFTAGETKVDDFDTWKQYQSREFEEKGNILNIQELASVFHFPTVSVEVNAIARVGAKKGEAPFNIPLRSLVDSKELTVIGRTDFRNKSEEFGVKLDDRKRHIYIIGKSGTGKSTLLENMAFDDVMEGRGVVIVDPHGEFADKIIDSIPEHRIEDAIVVDPSDTDWPISFNPLESVGEGFRGLVASGFVGVLKKIFGDSWGPRLEYILRNTTLALLESPNSTMMGIPRMLTDRAYREQVVSYVTDPVVRAFWQYEWNGMEPKQQAEAIGPILNKVGQFLSNVMIRNLTCQPKSTIDFRKAMDEKKILIVNLSKGKIGEDAMALLGSMIVTRVQLAAMSRANVPVDQRPDCFLYVDEFQNFATDSFATILSEARKYNLGLTIAHQYMAQLNDEVRDAVIGNVGSLVLFRVGTPDAEALQKEFAPTFEVSDMINLQKAHIYVKLLVDGFASQPFSAQTLPPKHVERSYREQVVAYSRSRYAKSRIDAEQAIDEVSGYRQRREAEEATKKAATILQGSGQFQPQRQQGGSYSQGPRQQAPQSAPMQQVAPQQRVPVQQPQVQQPVPQVTQPQVQPGMQQQPPQAVQVNQPAPQHSVPQPVVQVASPQPVVQTPQPQVQQAPPQQVFTPPPVPQPSMLPPIPSVQPQNQQVQAVPMPQQAVVQTVSTHTTTNEVMTYVQAQPPALYPDQQYAVEEQPVKPRKPRKEKPPKIMQGWVYREVSQRGGMKWYLGETESEFAERKAQRENELAAGGSTEGNRDMSPESSFGGDGGEMSLPTAQPQEQKTGSAQDKPVQHMVSLPQMNEPRGDNQQTQPSQQRATRQSNTGNGQGRDAQVRRDSRQQGGYRPQQVQQPRQTSAAGVIKNQVPQTHSVAQSGVQPARVSANETPPTHQPHSEQKPNLPVQPAPQAVVAVEREVPQMAAGVDQGFEITLSEGGKIDL